MSLLASLGCPCGRWWQAFKGAGLPIQAPRYSPPQDSLFKRPDSRALVAILLTPWHRPRCLKCHQPCTLYCCQPQTQNPATYHSLTPSLWYLVLVGIRERRRESSISWVVWTCKLVCLLGIIPEKDQKTWLSACDSA